MDTERPTIEPDGTLYRAARRTAAVAAVFCAAVFLLLAANSLRTRAVDPVQPARLHDLLLALNRSPRDEALKERVRRLDAQLRRDYFRRRAFALHGFYLLLGGMAVLLLALELARREPLPAPRAGAGREAWLAMALGRRSVAALGLALGGTLATLAVLSRHDAAAEYAKAAAKGGWPGVALGVPPPSSPPASLPGVGEGTRAMGLPPLAPAAGAGGPAGFTGPPPIQEGGAAPSGAGTVAAVPPAGVARVQPLPLRPSPPAGAGKGARGGGKPLAIAALVTAGGAAEWPGFRGPGGVGYASSKEAPAQWDGAKGEGVRWKVAVPLLGWNSPVVWGDRLFLAGGDKTRRAVLCFAAADGKLLWQKPVPGPGGEMKVMDDTGYAPSTVAADGKRVFAIFPDGQAAAFDFAGNPLWARKLGPLENNYGHAASLVVYGNRLLVQLDQGSDAQGGKSALLALDVGTGKTLWQAKRPVPNSWSTPIVIKAGGREQVVTCANPWIIAYDPADGKELWRADGLGGEVAPSPAFAGGYVVAACLGANMVAVRPDGTGDVTKTKVAWTASDNLPDIVSPLGVGDMIFLVTTDGMATCVDARTGKKVWEHPFDTPVRASPVLVGGRIYLTDTKGVTHIFEAGRAYKELGKAELGEETQASPAVAGGRIYLRGREHLYCIGAK